MRVFPLTLFLYPEGIGCLCVEIRRIFPFLLPSAEQTKSAAGSLCGLVGLLQ